MVRLLLDAGAQPALETSNRLRTILRRKKLSEEDRLAYKGVLHQIATISSLTELILKRQELILRPTLAERFGLLPPMLQARVLPIVHEEHLKARGLAQLINTIYLARLPEKLFCESNGL